MFRIIPTTKDGGGYKIEQSLMFDDIDRMTSSLGIYSGTFTLSVWVKINHMSRGQAFMGRSVSTGWPNSFGMESAGQLQFNSHTSAVKINSPTYWSHIVLSGGNLYVNGNIEETGWTGSIDPGMIGVECRLEMAEYHFIDGMALGANFFGMEHKGEWVPREYNGEHGAKGFYLPFHVDNIGKDESGNNNHFTPSASITPNNVFSDTPTRNYPTGDPTKSFSNSGRIPNMVYGNLHILSVVGGSGHNHCFATLPFPTYGKWYFETKVIVHGGEAAGYVTNLFTGYDSGDERIRMKDNNLLVPPLGAAGNPLVSNQIISIAVDMDNSLFNHWFNTVPGHQDAPFDATKPLIWGAGAWSGKDNFDIHINYGQVGFSRRDAIVSARPYIQDFIELNSENMENT